MAYTGFFLLTIILILFLTVFSNMLRARHTFLGSLTPNCLLTRRPIIFIYGFRSIFYFSSYWNLYTSFLAEHGYETYSLRLPWRSIEERKKWFEKFLMEQEKNNYSYHLIMDYPTLEEFSDLLNKLKSSVISVTVINEAVKGHAVNKITNAIDLLPIICKEVQLEATSADSMLLRTSYFLHQMIINKKGGLSLSSLGVKSKFLNQNYSKLLHRAQELAENDFTQFKSE